MGKTVRVFKRVKETPKMHKYDEDPPAGEAPIMRNLYLEKWFLGTTPPDEVKITVEVPDGTDV